MSIPALNMPVFEDHLDNGKMYEYAYTMTGYLIPFERSTPLPAPFQLKSIWMTKQDYSEIEAIQSNDMGSSPNQLEEYTITNDGNVIPARMLKDSQERLRIKMSRRRYEKIEALLTKMKSVSMDL